MALPITTKLKIVIAALVVIVIVLIAMFQSHQKQLAFESLQGCWEVEDGTYIVIDDTSMQVLELLKDGGYNCLYEDADIDCKYLSLLSSNAHRFRICRSKKSKFEHPMFRSESMELKLYPVIGAMCVIEDGDEVARLIKDNAMSVEYLS